jgi:hypothetical protein
VRGVFRLPLCSYDLSGLDELLVAEPTSQD